MVLDISNSPGHIWQPVAGLLTPSTVGRDFILFYLFIRPNFCVCLFCIFFRKFELRLIKFRLGCSRGCRTPIGLQGYEYTSIWRNISSLEKISHLRSADVCVEFRFASIAPKLLCPKEFLLNQKQDKKMNKSKVCQAFNNSIQSRNYRSASSHIFFHSAAVRIKKTKVKVLIMKYNQNYGCSLTNPIALNNVRLHSIRLLRKCHSACI